MLKIKKTASENRCLRVDLKDRSYSLHIGENLLLRAGEIIAPLLKQPRTVIVTDSNVGPLWLSLLTNSLDKATIKHDTIMLPAGEKTKSFEHLEYLIDRLLALKVERKTTLLAFGGGVIGDIVGFAAAVVLRGLNFIQIPTTVLAQVDSAIGGKTGINTPKGKNLVGAFHQPIAVLSDVTTLGTLPEREVRSGYAEIVKYALIGDESFFDWLEENGLDFIQGSPARRIHGILVSCEAKAEIVARDEQETGIRALLNLGHTFGHALEAQAGYGADLLHGEAVAIGMVMAADLSLDLGLCRADDLARLRSHLDLVGLPTNIRYLMDSHWTSDGLFEHMTQDKKVQDGNIAFVLLRRIGEAFLSRAVKKEQVIHVLEKYTHS